MGPSLLVIFIISLCFVSCDECASHRKNLRDYAAEWSDSPCSN